jgi:phospholipid/cholesterol/gamma-HCH transport system ATP-binding protein
MNKIAAIQENARNTGIEAIAVIVEVSHLYKSFGSNRVLDDFNLVLYEGENLVVMGKSGSGKSVLIKCISGLIKPDSGVIKVFGQDIGKLDHKELGNLRERIGFVFQYSALYDSMSVAENLTFPLRKHIRKKTKAEVRQMIEETLDNVGLRNTIDMMPSELSGGMKKRVGLARALILRPSLVLYDEPTAGLDPMTGKEISDLIVEVQEMYRTSSIIITHDPNCAEITGNRLVILANGKCYAEGTINQLRQMNDPEVKGFF